MLDGGPMVRRELEKERLAVSCGKAFFLAGSAGYCFCGADDALVAAVFTIHCAKLQVSV
jgi:hypothetical protein